MAFQVWLQFAGEVARSGDGMMSQRPPEQLPVVFQVLLSQVRAVWTFEPGCFSACSRGLIANIRAVHFFDQIPYSPYLGVSHS